MVFAYVPPVVIRHNKNPAISLNFYFHGITVIDIHHAVSDELCCVCTEMQLLYELRRHNQLSIQPLLKEVPLSVCIWKWLFSGLLSIFACYVYLLVLTE